MKYKWLIKEQTEINKEFLDAALGLEIIARLLLNRGIQTKEKAISYLNPDKYIESSPYEIPDLNRAKERIISALKNKEKITIFGDYDVDGVTSTACLLYTLKEFTEKVDFYIPSRLKEGYGLNKEAVEKIRKKHKAKLLITCDCGVTNHKEIEHANSLGLDVIVTDHHALPDPLPNAYAVLNPKLLPEDHKLHNLPGVGVAYKLAEAILEDNRQQTTDNREQFVIARSVSDSLASLGASSAISIGIASPSARNDKKQSSILQKEDLLDLVTLGMIADLAPLIDENRYLVQIGLPKLATTKKIGLQELLRICGYTPTSALGTQHSKLNAQHSALNTESVGFGIAPRINAVGRLTDANLAVKLLTTKNLIEAMHIATELDIQNKQRQLLCEQTLEEALLLISEEVDLTSDKCIVLANANWHHGVIGIVASRIVDKFGLPTILIAIDKEQNIARGSGRSSGNFNIIEALNNSSKHLEKHGGHKAACGLSIKPENINDFIQAFKGAVEESIEDSDIGPTLKIDFELSTALLSFELMNLINKLSPFGFGNRTPVFVSNKLEVVSIRTIGKNNQHLKLYLKGARDKGQGITDTGQEILEALVWNYYEEEGLLKIGDKVKVAYSPKINNFNGESCIQLQVKDIMLVDHKQLTTDKRQFTNEVKILDYRGKVEECISLLTSKHVVFFAETKQKDFLPLKTSSRTKINECKKLVFLESPPDENTFIEITKRANAQEIYLAFSNTKEPTFKPQEILKRLIGMLKYAQKYKKAKVKKEDLESALGLSKSATAYAIETLVRIGFLEVKRDLEELSINIVTSSRQNYLELVEYNLFVSELKQTSQFTAWLQTASISEIQGKIYRSLIAKNLVQAT